MVALSLSLCMIVKNEEANLERCLISVKGVVDEIIVVDTGSTDHTVEIAAAHGARIYHHPWQNDFSLARNYSLGYASGEWILYLDADEELEVASRQRLRPTLDATDADALRICVRSFTLPDSVVAYQDSFQVRLFRNRPQYRFEQIVHNQISPSIRRAGGKISDEPSLICWHYGYMGRTVQGNADRYQRSLVMLEQAVNASPKNPYLNAKLGILYYHLGDYSLAYDYLYRLITELNAHELDLESLYEVLLTLAMLAIQQGYFELAVQSAQAAYDIVSADSPAGLSALSTLARAYASLGEGHLRLAERLQSEVALALPHIEKGSQALEQARQHFSQLLGLPGLRPEAKVSVQADLELCQAMLAAIFSLRLRLLALKSS